MFFKVYFWEREQAGEGQRERARERERERIKSRLWLSAQSPMQGLNPRTVRSWRESRSRVRRLTDWATQVPENLLHFNLSIQGVESHIQMRRLGAVGWDGVWVWVIIDTLVKWITCTGTPGRHRTSGGQSLEWRSHRGAHRCYSWVLQWLLWARTSGSPALKS